jgi:hypothetical protein
VVRVSALWSKRLNSIRASGKGRQVNVLEGQEVVFGPSDGAIQAQIKSDKIARRNIRGFDFPDGTHVACSEFSFVSMIQNSDVLAKVSKSKDEDDRVIADRMIRMAACVYYVTRSHGNYAVVSMSR